MAEGLLGFCDQLSIPYPKTLADFEATLVHISRQTNFQAGLSFRHKSSHQKFYELLGMNPEYAGLPYQTLIELAKEDASIRRGLMLVSAFSTVGNPAESQRALARSAKLFREVVGPNLN